MKLKKFVVFLAVAIVIVFGTAAIIWAGISFDWLTGGKRGGSITVTYHSNPQSVAEEPVIVTQKVTKYVNKETGVAATKAKKTRVKNNTTFKTTGYHFTEWNLDGTTFTGKGKEYLPGGLTDDIIVFAMWEVNTYKISFSTQALNAIAPETQEVKYLEEIRVASLADDLRGENYRFGGWWTEANGQGTEIYNGMPADFKKLTVTAQAYWIYTGAANINFTISYNLSKATAPENAKLGEDGTVTRRITKDNIDSGNGALATVSPSSTFNGWWFRYSNGNEVKVTTKRQAYNISREINRTNVDLFAKWGGTSENQANNCTVTVVSKTTTGASGPNIGNIGQTLKVGDIANFYVSAFNIYKPNFYFDHFEHTVGSAKYDTDGSLRLTLTANVTVTVVYRTAAAETPITVALKVISKTTTGGGGPSIGNIGKNMTSGDVAHFYSASFDIYSGYKFDRFDYSGGYASFDSDGSLHLTMPYNTNSVTVTVVYKIVTASQDLYVIELRANGYGTFVRSGFTNLSYFSEDLVQFQKYGNEPFTAAELCGIWSSSRGAYINDPAKFNTTTANGRDSWIMSYKNSQGEYLRLSHVSGINSLSPSDYKNYAEKVGTSTYKITAYANFSK